MPPTAQPLRRSTNYSRYAQPMQATAPKPIVKVPSPKAPAALKITGNPELWQMLAQDGRTDRRRGPRAGARRRADAHD